MPPEGRPDEPVSPCPCVQDGRTCPANCDPCPVDCPERGKGAATYEQYDDADDPPAAPAATSSWSNRRRRRPRSTSRRSGSAASSPGSARRSSRGSSGGSTRGTTGGTTRKKKAGAGAGAAVAAAAGGFGALQGGTDDASSTDPDSGYHSGYGSPEDPQGGVEDLGAVVDHATAPIVSFSVLQDGRLVVVTGTWASRDLPRGCQVEISAVEGPERVVIEAQAAVTRLDVRLGDTCPPPGTWSTGTSYLVLDEPLGDREVVTDGPLLRGGEEVDPPGAAAVPRTG